MYLSHSELFKIDGHEFLINVKPSGIYPEMLRPMIEQLFVMQAYHAKVLVVRFELKFVSVSCYGISTDAIDNRVITRFRKSLFKKLKTRYRFSRIGYCWVREQEDSISPHYHFVLYLNGDRVRHPQKVHEIGEQCWVNVVEGVYSIPENCYYMLLRNDQSNLAEVVNRIAYFAKGRGKGRKAIQTKNYSTSRLRL